MQTKTKNKKEYTYKDNILLPVFDSLHHYNNNYLTRHIDVNTVCHQPVSHVINYPVEAASWKLRARGVEGDAAPE